MDKRRPPDDLTGSTILAYVLVGLPVSIVLAWLLHQTTLVGPHNEHMQDRRDLAAHVVAIGAGLLVGRQVARRWRGR